jgi:uncharacterized membrane protein
MEGFFDFTFIFQVLCIFDEVDSVLLILLCLVDCLVWVLILSLTERRSLSLVALFVDDSIFLCQFTPDTMECVLVTNNFI